MTKHEPKTVLINEAKRAWSLPALPLPDERNKLDERGKPYLKGERQLIAAKDATERAALVERQRRVTELETVKRFRPPMLEAAGRDGAPGRIEVPNWYLAALLESKFWRQIFGRRDDGIAIGMTHADRLRRSQDEALAATRNAADDANERAGEAERRAKRLEAEARAAEERAAHLEAELAKRQASPDTKAEKRAKEAEAELAKAKAELAKLEERLTAPAKGETAKG